MKSWQLRVPPENPSITDPIWPGDPFWRSRKFPRTLRAKIAHEFHHSPDQPNLNQLSEKYGVHYGALASWCFAYPFGSRAMPDRNYVTAAFSSQSYRARVEAKHRQYVRELHKHAQLADPTWFLMGDPLPSRAAINQKQSTNLSAQKITLPFVLDVFTIDNNT